MKAWFEQLAPREQRLVMAMSALIIVFFIYSLVWLPLNTNLEKAEQKLARQQALLSWVQENTAQYQQAAKGSAKRSSGGSISGVVNASARQAGITIARIQPQGDDIQVWIDEVAFSTMLTWLDTLSNSRGIQVKNIDMIASDTAGSVKVRRLHLGKS